MSNSLVRKLTFWYFVSTKMYSSEMFKRFNFEVTIMAERREIRLILTGGNHAKQDN